MTIEHTHKQLLLEQQQMLFKKIVQKYIAVKHPLNRTQAHKRLEKLHNKLGYDGEPIGYSTFCRWLNETYDSAYIAQRQDGRVAGKRARQTKLKSNEMFAFMANVQVDCLHAPIFFIDSYSYKPLDNVPIEYFSHEQVTTCLLANTTNFESGSERRDYLIEHFKSMFLSKPDLHIDVGYPKPWYPCGLVISIKLDGASANKSNDVHQFLARWFTIAHMAKTQHGEQKGSVESFNDWFKDNVLNGLPGSFNDKLPIHLRDTINARVNAALTIREYHIIKTRILLDYLYSKHKDSKTGQTFSREEEWINQCSYNPPPYVEDVDELCLFGGVKEHRTINANEGITIIRNGIAYWYNDTELQTLRRYLSRSMGKKFSGEVSVTYSIINEYFIWVLNPKTKAMLKIPMVTPPKQTPRNSENDDFLNEIRDYDNSIDLTSMTNDEIINHAVKRKHKILDFKKRRKQASKKHAIDSKEALNIESQKAKDYKENQRLEAIQAVKIDTGEAAQIKPTTTDETPTSQNYINQEDWKDDLDYGESS